jgi:hypothetical protein
MEFPGQRIDAEAARRMVGARDAKSIRGDDFYASPPEAVEALLRVVRFGGPIWEPACGDGAICKVLAANGYAVVATDLVDRGYGTHGRDFLFETRSEVPNIVTNPPFKLAEQFAEKALELTTGKVAFLMRLVWLEGQRRRKFFEKTPLSQVLVFSGRIPRMHRGDYDGPKSSSSIAFAWFVWDHAHKGPPTLGWL